MQNELTNLVSECFEDFIDGHGFHQQKDLIEDSTYLVQYVSNIFVINLEEYRQELYVTLYKTGYSDKELSLFNLLAYLARPLSDAPVADYQHSELDREKRYRKQLTHIVTVLEEYFGEIVQFFSTGDYISKFDDMEKFIMSKYPGLFAKRKEASH